MPIANVPARNNSLTEPTPMNKEPMTPEELAANQAIYDQLFDAVVNGIDELPQAPPLT